ncbi:MAG: SiaB family protein kinase [Cytophagales bacterium]|nr:SiaB family protein kinase [Cytophagales bacterium]MDW8384668.1 SiaB family protein kinase [Flammeovirgaceae bacterium]
MISILDNSIQHYRSLQSKNIVLAYKGSASNELLDTILSIVDNKIKYLEPHAKLRRKVYTIVVELLQNIYHHLDIKTLQEYILEDLDAILFLLLKTDEGYEIIIGNYIAQKDTIALKSRLESICRMSLEEIKNTYREALNNGEFSAKGGAGLGFLDIARRSGKQLEYQFEKVPDRDFSFFTLKVKISLSSE